MVGQWKPRAIAGPLCLAALAAAGPARADLDPGRARTLFDEGVRELEQNHCARAAELLALSYSAFPAPASLVDLALANECLGRTATAWVLFGETAREAGAVGEADRAAFAELRAHELEPHLLKVTVVVGPPTGHRAPVVTLDRARLDPERWGSALPVDPGPHELRAGGDGMREWVHPFVAGDANDATIQVPPLEVDAAIAVRGEPRTERRRSSFLAPVGWTLGAVGLAALGTGAAFGIAGLVNKDAATQGNACVAHRDALNCNSAGAADIARARQDMLLADTAYAIGGALVIGAGVLLLADWVRGHEKRASPSFQLPQVVSMQGSTGLRLAW